MNIIVDPKILNKIPSFNPQGWLIEFEDDYDVMIKDSKVDELINETSKRLMNTYDYESIPTISKLKETRDGYKAFGKDPSHTRPACEALIRRVIKGNELYRLGDVIDLGNVVSMETLRSVCVVDAAMVEGDVNITVSSNEISYEGIGRGLINAKDLITYVDNQGIFGSPTSDTNRTKVTVDTHQILIMLICFSNNDLEKDCNLLLDIYKKYTKIKKITKIC